METPHESDASMTPASWSLGGRVALVTGAAGNIGRAIAIELAGRGADLVLADRPADDGQLEETAERCRSERGDVEVALVRFDVRDPDAAGAALDEAAAELGRHADLIVNNAGYQGRFANLLDYDLDDARLVLEVNALGMMVVLQAAARRIVTAGSGGVVVNVASMAAVGAANMPAYSASKGAVISLTRAAAKDLAPHGIRVNSVSPGFIGPGVMWETQVAAQAAVPSPYYGDDEETVAAQMIGMVPLGRYGSVEEVARSVAYLLSDDSSFVTGVDLQLSGGSN